MWAIGNLPAYQQRMDCWLFVRSYQERVESYSLALRHVDETVQCLFKAKSVQSLLAVVLAVGNFLNGGTTRGQADGFNIDGLATLESIKDYEGKDIRHLIFELFHDNFSDDVISLVEELRPLFSNVSRRMGKDAEGAERCNRSMQYCLEDFDICCNALSKELGEQHETMQTVLQYLDDPADAFRLQMPPRFTAAKEQITSLLACLQKVKKSYAELLKWYKVATLKSSDFCLLWDNFLIPGDWIMLRPDKVKKEVLVPAFCQGRPFGADDLLTLWRLKEPTVAVSKANRPGNKQPRTRAGPEAGASRRKSNMGRCAPPTRRTGRRKTIRAGSDGVPRSSVIVSGKADAVAAAVCHSMTVDRIGRRQRSTLLPPRAPRLTLDGSGGGGFRRQKTEPSSRRTTLPATTQTTTSAAAALELPEVAEEKGLSKSVSFKELELKPAAAAAP
eukprot:TRINITY_DN7507_c0_g1_i3.p1 TRINITY_DN7507_c0_g1~~TRINITY_DN7507_c0_g1_i3.p1  ORF type:complete len:445 (+),score=124.06 TRINITY_DN7507_c0_g1_i3:1139-2473(+)